MDIDKAVKGGRRTNDELSKSGMGFAGKINRYASGADSSHDRKRNKRKKLIGWKFKSDSQILFWVLNVHNALLPT